MPLNELSTTNGRTQNQSHSDCLCYWWLTLWLTMTSLLGKYTWILRKIRGENLEMILKFWEQWWWWKYIRTYALLSWNKILSAIYGRWKRRTRAFPHIMLNNGNIDYMESFWRVHGPQIHDLVNDKFSVRIKKKIETRKNDLCEFEHSIQFSEKNLEFVIIFLRQTLPAAKNYNDYTHSANKFNFICSMLSRIY